MGKPIDIGNIQVGDRVRVVNSLSDVTFTVREITDMGSGNLLIWGGSKAYGGRLGEAPPYNQFFLIERPSQTEARGLAEVSAMNPQIPHDVINVIAKTIGLKEKKKGGRKTRRRMTRSRGKNSRKL